MRTKSLQADHAGAIEEAADLIKRGELVAFPTDTVYGLGADPFNALALKALYESKDRALEKGIPILLSGTVHLSKVASAVPEYARALMAHYWPGPLTLILPRHPSLPAIISPNENIAIRIPDHEVARRFIEAAGGVVAASSANRSGQPPATNGWEALEVLAGRAAAVLDAGPVRLGRASTILDCTVSPPKLVRQGPIPAGDLLEIPVNQA